ncbi:hypothetical protein PC121_g11373 [Phytophthora cactorum]|nr:hypothetical protein PC120_g10007 [Phytophthora cactorum]KAG3065419.1 hypothetical protein PC121_g11373 [Phytophthora cactorum]
MIAETPPPPLDLEIPNMSRATDDKSTLYQGMPTDSYRQIPGDKATEIRLFSFQRPHMRAFHYSWLSFFIAFFGWFSIPPIMPTIKKQLKLTEDQVSNTNIVSLASTILGRLIVGPLCDHYGARTIQSALLVVGAVPVASAALHGLDVGEVFHRSRGLYTRR